MSVLKMFKIMVPLCITGAVIASAIPSYFGQNSEFYRRDFEHQKGMKLVEYGSRIGIIGDEIYIGRPRVWVNYEIALCECGREAIHISFKNGILKTSCPEHSECPSEFDAGYPTRVPEKIQPLKSVDKKEVVTTAESKKK